jgi:hypothetical protein
VIQSGSRGTGDKKVQDKYAIPGWGHGPILQMVLALGLGLAGLAGAGTPSFAASGSALSEEPIPLKGPDELPGRTPPIIEIGPKFLGAGDIPEGIELPTGAIWTPALWVFGNYRTGFNYFDTGDDDTRVLEWANSMDVFFNLQLSGTERILLGLAPFHDDDNAEFSGYAFEPDSRDGFVNGLNPDIETFFFEGEFGEIFPELDPEDSGIYDFGFSVGRQPIFFQDGMMFNDRMDSVALTRDTVIIPGFSVDTRLTGLFAWNEINRDDNREDQDAFAVGLFTETDFPWSSTSLDVAYVFSDDDDTDGGDGFYIGASATQRIDVFDTTWNTTFRANGSVATEEESAAVSTGGLLFAEISTTPKGTEDVAYGNFFWGIDEYSSAARDNLAGGPLGRVGLLFAAVGLGNYGAPLSNRADEVVGGAIGYQKFFNDFRTQVVLEVGGRKGTAERIDDAAAIGARLQQAIGNRFIIRLDGFARWQEDLGEGFGARTELLTRF